MNCPKCGREVGAGAVFCPDCGTRIMASPIPSQQQRPLPNNGNQTVRVNTAPTEQSYQPNNRQAPGPYNRCSVCGRPIPQGQGMCRDCMIRNRAQVPNRQPAQKKNNNSIVIIILAIAIVLLIVIGAVLGIVGYNKGWFSKSSEAKAENEPVFIDDEYLEDEEIEAEPEESSEEENVEEESQPEVEENKETEDEEKEEEPEESSEEESSQKEKSTKKSTKEESSKSESSMTEEEKYPDVAPKLLYFIDNCDKKYLSESDLTTLSDDECMYARNACFAKSGRKFKDAQIRNFFKQFDWYEEKYDADTFGSISGIMNEYQEANWQMVYSYEQKHGY